jgi:hypothetical protein
VLQEVVDDSPTDTVAARLFGGVDRLQLHVIAAELFDRPDAEQCLAIAEAEEGDTGIDQAVEVEGVDVLRGSHPASEGEMPLEQGHDIVSAWVVHR